MRATDTIIVKQGTGGKDQPRGEILVTIYGANIGRKVDLDPFRPAGTIIGRDVDADIVADDESVSRRHCRLLATTEGWVIEDLKSTNGTWVAGQQTSRTLLCDGDLIKVGSTIYKFLSNANVEAAYHEEIYRMAIYDGLTQIHNRRYFEEFTDREIIRAQRHDRPLSLLIFDVDHFKHINDGFGHLSGDHVLRTMASLVRSRVRRDELFARYAGDEFVVVLPETDSGHALEFAETLRSLVAQTEFVFDAQRLPVTISVGVGGWSREMDSPEQLVGAADQALYRAKEAGRNRASV
ncbi:MAG: GGDEF domain-containing protein [Myxococcales bacterium]|nr:GGDEF domain-containing protein [Myxococcales bacterium]MCB9546426.1 GGDEF domain-containing protein [Myxococcales bacterium]